MGSTPVEGKVAFYFHAARHIKKAIKIEAAKQGVTDSALLEACIIQALKNPPLIGRRDGRGRKKKVVEPAQKSELEVLGESIANDVLAEIADMDLGDPAE